MRLLCLLPILLLTGCLTTTKLTFTDDNSIRASQSKPLVRFVEAWERRYGAVDSPREVIDQNYRVLEIDGLVVVEESNGSVAEYYAIAMLGNRPVACFIHDSKLQEIADAHNVTLVIEREEDSQNHGPVPIKADGSAEELFTFVVDAFQNGTLACYAPPKGEAS